MSSSEISKETILEHVRRVTESSTFSRSPQAARFLVFVVDETLGSRADSLKAYKIGVQALGVTGPRSDPDGVARMQANRTRKLLASYYSGPGKDDALRIILPTGSYQPYVELLHSESGSQMLEPLTVALEACNLISDAADWSGLGAFFTQELAAALQRFEGISVQSTESSAVTQYGLSSQIQIRQERIRAVTSLRETKTGTWLWHDRFDTSMESVDPMTFGEALAARIAPAIADPILGVLPQAKRTRSGVGSEISAQSSFREFILTASMPALDNALRVLQRAVLQYPESLTYRIEFAHVNAAMYALDPADRQDYLETAEDQARLVLAQAPSSTHARLVKGFVHFHRRESEAARHELWQAIRGNPLQMHTVGFAGMLLSLLGDWQSGIAQVDATFARFPGAPGFLHLAHCAYHFFENGNPEEAYRRSELFDSPELAWSPLLRAVCLAVLGRRYEASRAISELLSIAPDFPKHARTYLSGYLYAESLVEAFASALREAGLRIGPAQSRPQTRRLSERPMTARLDDSEARIGVLHSLSGTMAICERHLVQAAQLAVDEINGTGGVLGRHITAIVEDGESNAATFAMKARKLVTHDNVISLFGCWTSACRKAVRPIVEDHNLLLWYPVQYEGLERSRNIIYTGSCLNQQIEPATRWAIAGGKRKFFLVGSDYVFPRTANYLIRALVEGAGCEVVGEEYRPLGCGQFRDVADRIKRTTPDFVFNTINGTDNLVFFRELGEQGLSADNCPVMSFSLSELELPDLKGGASGHFACWGYFQSVDAPENRELLRRFRDRYGEHEVLSDPAVTAYAQIHLWKQVVESAGSFATEAMLKAIVGSELSLGGDTLEVRSNNHVKRRALIGKIRPDNQFDVVWGSTEAIAPKPWLGVEESSLASQALLVNTLGGVPDMVQEQAALRREMDERLTAANPGHRRFRSDFPPHR